MYRLLFASAVLLGASASAQTTTNCTTTTWGSINCTTQPSATINTGILKPIDYYGAVNRGYEQGVQMRRQAEQYRQQQELARQQSDLARQRAEVARQQAEATAARQHADELHRAQSLEAAKIVSAGDCPGAERYALEVGNLVLAKQVKDFCAE